MTQSNKEIFCPTPWIGYSLRNNGLVRVCCHANQGPNKGILMKDDGSLYTYKDDINEARNSKTIRDIRKKILQNEWHPECIRCKKENMLDMRTRTTTETEIWKSYLTKDEAKKLTAEDGSINPKEIPLRYFDLRFGNVCNLKCRMCGPTDSDGWYKEYYDVLFQRNYDDYIRKLKIVKVDNKYILENTPFGWFKEDIFWDNMRSQMENMVFCYMVGGEPLLIKEHYKFLEECIKSGNANHIKIDYNTNLTVLPDYAFDLWKHFKSVNFGVSIDGLDKVNDYIRYPSRWDHLIKNVKTIDSLGDNIKLWFSFTVMVYNMLNLPEFICWKLEQNYNKMPVEKGIPIISSHPLHTPHHLNIKMFPEESKRLILNVYSEKIAKMNESSYLEIVKTKYEKLLNSYTRFMLQEDYSSEIPNFWSFNNKIDESRNQKIEDYIPELKGLL